MADKTVPTLSLRGDMKTKRFLYLGLFIAVLMVTACGSKATPEPTSLPLTDTPAPTATEVPKPTGNEGGVPMGFTEDGLPYRGDPDAPVVLEEHSEFQ